MSRSWVDPRFFVERVDERARSFERSVEVVDPEERMSPLPGVSWFGASNVGWSWAPQACKEQNGAVVVAELAEVVVGRGAFGLT